MEKPVYNKSFYFTVPERNLSYIKDSLDIMYIPYWIEQSSDTLELDEGVVAFVFPDLHGRVYNYIVELFDGHGRELPYPEQG